MKSKKAYIIYITKRSKCKRIKRLRIMNVRNDVIITTGSYFQDNVFHKNISFIFLTKLVCFALEPKIAEIF